MAKSFRYKDGTRVMEGTTAWELKHFPKAAKTDGVKVTTLDGHMKTLDTAWRKLEGRNSVTELTELECMLEGRTEWDPAAIKALKKELGGNAS